MATTKFSLQAKTIIESATLELDARQLEALAEAAPYLSAVCEFYEVHRPRDAEDPGDVKGRVDAVAVALDPVGELLASIASLVSQVGTIAPKRRVVRRKNPTSGK